MSPINALVDFSHDTGTTRWQDRHARVTAPASGYTAAGLVFTAAILTAFAALLVATAWMFWVLASGTMGSGNALVAIITLVAAAAAFAGHTGRGLVASLVLIGFGGLALLIAALFAMAGCALMTG